MSRDLESLLKAQREGKGEKKEEGEGGKNKEPVKRKKKALKGEFSFEERRYVYVSDEVYKVLNLLKLEERVMLNHYVSEILWEELKKRKPELIKKIK